MAKPQPAMEYLRQPDKLAEAPVYAVFGPEDYLRRRCLKALLKQLEARGFEAKRMEPEDTLAPVLDELRSPSMFGGATAVVIGNRRVGNRQEATTRFKEEFLAYLESPSKRNVLVFDAATWQRNLAVPKRVSADFPTIQSEELKPWDARGFGQILEVAAKDYGLTLAGDAANALRDYTGGNLGRADMELQKLALLVENGRVSSADVAEACGYEGVDVTFALCDAILTGARPVALRHAASLAGKAEIGTVLSLFALLRMQVAALGRAAVLLSQGATAAKAAADAKIRLREQQRPAFINTARALDRTRVRRAIEVLMDADEAMKSSSPDPANLLLAVVVRLCEILHVDRTRVGAAR
jgi:DNA polymerase III delta subunit